jgi:hypothetical protein
MKYFYYNHKAEIQKKVADSRNELYNLKKKAAYEKYMWLMFHLNILFIIVIFEVRLLRPRNSKQWPSTAVLCIKFLKRWCIEF